jgi:glucose dehydrogenase
MPAFDLPAEELDAVVGFVRSLNAGATVGQAAGTRVAWGKPAPGDWLTYDGNLSANRYSELKQIHTGNVAALRSFLFLTTPWKRPRWKRVG